MKNKKIVFLLILVAVLVVLGVLVQQRGSNEPRQENKQEVRQIRPTFLNPENFTFVEKRLAERYLALENLSPDAAIGDRLNLYVSIASDEIGLGNIGKGKEYYEKALSLAITEQEKAFIYHRLSLVLVEMNDFDASIEAINRAIAITPAEPEYWKWLIAVRQDRYGFSVTQLKEIYEQALEKTGNSQAIKDEYAKFLTKNGELDTAEKIKTLPVAPTGNPAVELSN